MNSQVFKQNHLRNPKPKISVILVKSPNQKYQLLHTIQSSCTTGNQYINPRLPTTYAQRPLNV